MLNKHGWGGCAAGRGGSRGLRLGRSDGRVHGHDEVEDILHGLEQVLPVIDLDVELVLDGVVDEHARLHAHLVVLVVPVRLERDGHSVPAVRVDVAKSLAADLDDALGEHVGLLLEVVVMELVFGPVPWVVAVMVCLCLRGVLMIVRSMRRCVELSCLLIGSVSVQVPAA